MPRGVYKRKKKKVVGTKTKGKAGYFLDPATRRRKNKVRNQSTPTSWKKNKPKKFEIPLQAELIPSVDNIPFVKGQPIDGVRILLHHHEQALIKDIQEHRVTEISYRDSCATMAFRVLEGKGYLGS